VNEQTLWNSLAEKAGITLDADQISRLNSFLDLLFAANERMNLTRIATRADAEVLHIGDALTLLPHLHAKAHRLADVGAGGGVPGIVLAIVRPDIRVTLIEATRKKADFLRDAAKTLQLPSVAVIADRAEKIARTPSRESFDIVVARAVALLPILVEWLLPLTKVGGDALAMKGPKAIEELNQARIAIRLLGGGDAQAIPTDLPQTSGHLIVKIPKIRPTPARFPRDPSIAKGSPISR
jgi:16S rRNA (guanine527-N7)-methyltransferase